MRPTLLVAAAVVMVVGATTGCQSRQLQQKAASGPSGPAEPTSSSAPSSDIVRQHVTGTAPAAGTCHVQRSNGEDLPDPACTPGATDPTVTQDNIATTICVKGYTTEVRPPTSETNPMKAKLYGAYAVPAGTRSELDHLISEELGGSSDAKNLWPEVGKIPNPKDPVENRLHAMVCAGVLSHGTQKHLPLAAAQQLIATDWTTAIARAQRQLVP
jgi:hypothetical protein